MVLSQETIQDLVTFNDMIVNFNSENLQTSSYDLTNGEIEDKYSDTILKPGEYRRVATKEWVNLPNNVAAFCKTKSSLARMGIVAGDVGGWIDPGFKGNITLSVFNLGDREVDLKDFKSTTQIVFLRLDKTTLGYDGHYQDSSGIKESIFL